MTNAAYACQLVSKPLEHSEEARSSALPALVHLALHLGGIRRQWKLMRSRG